MKNLLVASLLLVGATSFNAISAAQPDCQMKIKATNRTNDLPASEQRLVTIPATANAWGYYDNRVSQCISWELGYDSEGFTDLSVYLLSAPNSFSLATLSFVPNTFLAFAGTIVTGVNPMTDLSSGYLTALGYYPYIRVQARNAAGVGSPLTTGSINIVLNGWKSPNMLSHLELKKKEVTK